MIYDCVTFFNELDLLEIRLNVLKDVVDRFVIVEAGETHTGNAKPLHYEIGKDRFAAFADRIIYVKIEKFPEGLGPWERECHQRNEIMRGLAGAKDGDVILISDLDEIPRPELIAKWHGAPGLSRFNMRSFGFYLNMEDFRCRNMCGTVMLHYEDLKSAFDGSPCAYDEFMPERVNRGTTVSKIRRRAFPRAKGGERKLHNSGWHFTCLGGAAAMLTKMRAVAPHRGFDPNDPSLTVAKLEELLAKGQGPALKMNCFAVEVDDSYPKYVREHLDEYRHLVFPVTPEYTRKTRWPRLCRWLQGRLIQAAELLVAGKLHYALHVLRVAIAKD